jgi:hypothetical protein
MIVALYIALALVVVGLPLWLMERRYKRRNPDAPEPAATEECCGMHITCERDSLLASVSDKIEYYDDEELDAFANRRADAYSDAEIEQFRDVLLTLQPDDIAGWARSIQLRNIELPTEVRDELLMIVAETRASRLTTDNAPAV